jgi:hypothetical protein
MIRVKVSLLKRRAVLHRGQKSLMTRQRTFIGDDAFQIASGHGKIIYAQAGGVIASGRSAASFQLPSRAA